MKGDGDEPSINSFLGDVEVEDIISPFRRPIGPSPGEVATLSLGVAQATGNAS